MIDKNMQMQKWEKIRKQGKKRFVITQGVVTLGIPVGVLSAIVTYFAGKELKNLLWFISLVAGNVILWSLGGYLYGDWLWNSSEKRYNIHINGLKDNKKS